MSTSPCPAAGRLLVTGATGYLGRALLPGLLADGWNLTLVLRGFSAHSGHARILRDALEPYPVEWRERILVLRGDMREVELGLQPSDYRGHWGALHLAALPKLGGADAEEMIATHQGGARELGHMAAADDWRMVMHVSTAFVPMRLGQALPEAPTPEDVAGSNPYETTKAAAERILASLLGGRLEIVRPGIVLPSESCCGECLRASPLGPFSRALTALRRQFAPDAVALPGDPETRPGFARLADVASFIRHRLRMTAAATEAATAPRYWNLVGDGPSLGRIVDALAVGTSGGFRMAADSTEVSPMLSAWLPYLRASRAWDTPRTTAEGERAGCEIAPVEVAEVAAPLLRLLVAAEHATSSQENSAVA